MNARGNVQAHGDVAPRPDRSLFDDALVWDAHAGFETLPGMDLGKLRQWKDAGIDFLSVNVGYDVWTWEQSVRSLAFARHWVTNHSSEYLLADSVDQIELARTSGRLAIAFDLEGTRALDDSLELLELFYRLGVRQILFAYNRDNSVGGGCHGEDVGLSGFGKTLVEAMNELGILVDCSHCGYRTTMDAMSVSRAPVIFSHSNARDLTDHERNIHADQARRCAETGGVVGVNGIDLFLGGGTQTSRLADHVEYFLDLIGDEHVGIGLDYFFDAESEEAASGASQSFAEVLAADTSYWPPTQYPDGAIACAQPGQIRELAELLTARNHSERTVRNVLGRNFWRVAKEVWT